MMESTTIIALKKHIVKANDLITIAISAEDGLDGADGEEFLKESNNLMEKLLASPQQKEAEQCPEQKE